MNLCCSDIGALRRRVCDGIREQRKEQRDAELHLWISERPAGDERVDAPPTAADGRGRSPAQSDKRLAGPRGNRKQEVRVERQLVPVEL